jgi:serine/threonine protein kinase
MKFSDVYFVFPLMEADLRDIIKSDNEITNEHAQYFLYQLLEAMEYMLKCGIIHR